VAGWIPYAVAVLVFAGLAYGVIFQQIPQNELTLAGPNYPTPIQHVFTIVLENAGLSDALGAPYLKQLYNTYAGANHYYGVCHPSAPNYIAMTSGAKYQCGSDAVNQYFQNNIADLVTGKGETWNAYMESMPFPCDPGWAFNGGGQAVYKPGHNPFLYYSDLGSLGSKSGSCYQHDLPLSSFNPANTPANYVFISPNMMNDGHNTSVGYASNWLSGYLPKLLAEPWASSTVFFVVIDEGPSSDTSGYAGLNGGHTYLATVSPYSQGVGIYTPNSSPYSLLCTVEWLMGTGTSGSNECGANFPAMKSMFNFGGGSGNPTAKFSVSPTTVRLGSNPGTVTWTASATGGTPPYSYVADGLPQGCLASGLSQGGSYQCTPSQAGTYPATVTVTDSLGGTGTATATLIVTNAISSLTVTLSVSPNPPIMNQTYNLLASANGGAPPYTYQWSGLSTGCGGANGASVSCVAASVGYQDTSVTVTDSMGTMYTANINFTVAAIQPHSGPPTLTFTTQTWIGLLASAGISLGIVVAWAARRPEWGIAILVVSGVVLVAL